jgi:hypothetical protein
MGVFFGAMSYLSERAGFRINIFAFQMATKHIAFIKTEMLSHTIER